MTYKLTVLVFFSFFLNPISSWPASASSSQKSSFSKKAFTEFTPAQFSKAIWAFHSKNLKGQGLKAALIESHAPTAKVQETLKDQLIVEPKFFERISSDEFAESHASKVALVLHLMAPEAELIVLPFEAFTSVGRVHHTLKGPIFDYLKKTQVINISFQIEAEILEGICKKLFSLPPPVEPKQESLIVLAAGNQKQNLSHSKEYDLPMLNPSYMEHLIIVGSVNSTFRVSGNFSNYPGENPLIQQNFLCALGEEVTIGTEKDSGTSFAAPTVAGAALLIKQKYPELDMLQVKEVLLESAARSFFIENPLPEQEKGKGPIKIKGLFIWDAEDDSSKYVLFRQNSKHYDFNIEFYGFSPNSYGKGVLDLHAALIYADLKFKNPTWDKIKLRQEMKRILKEKHQSAGLTILKALRRYKAKKMQKAPA